MWGFIDMLWLGCDTAALWDLAAVAPVTGLFLFFDSETPWIAAATCLRMRA